MTTTTNDALDELTLASAEPKLDELIHELNSCTPVNNGWNSARYNDDVRFCRWPGQHPDGRKHVELQPAGEKVWPWNKCADGRPMTCDEVINELVATDFVTFFRAQFKLRGANNSSQASAKALQIEKLLKWYVGAHLYKVLAQEVPLFSQYVYTYGWGALLVTWEMEQQMQLVTQTLEQIIQASLTPGAPAALQALPEMILNKDMDELTVELITSMRPEITPRRARQAIRQLRSKGVAEIPMPYVCRNEPGLRALKPWDEIIISPTTRSAQTGRIFVREWLTEEQVMENVKATGDGWDEEWARAVCATKGRMSTWDATNNGCFNVGTATAAALGLNGAGSNYLCETIQCYQRQLSEEDLMPAVYRTVFSPHVKAEEQDKPLYGKHGILPFRHGRIPIIIRKYEHLAPTICSSRGVPEIMATWQREEKVMNDSTIDLSSMAVLPPYRAPKLLGETYEIVPGAALPSFPGGGDFEFLKVPTAGEPLAFKVKEELRIRIDRYFGLVNENIPRERVMAKLQMRTDSNLMAWTETFQQVVGLVKQGYLPADDVLAVTGSPPLWAGDPASIEAQEDFVMRFDARELDPEYLELKLAAYMKYVIPLNSAGRLDMGKFEELVMRSIDPDIANEVILDEGSASKQLFQRVQNDFMLMATGNEPEYVANDPTSKTQLEMAMATVRNNPIYQQQLQQQPDGLFAQRVQKWVKNRQQSVAQERNKQVGIYAVEPGPGQ